MLTWPGLDAVRPLLLWASQLNSAGSLSPARKTQPCFPGHPKTSPVPPANPQAFLSQPFSPPSVALLLPVPGGDPRLQLPHSHAGSTRCPWPPDPRCPYGALAQAPEEGLVFPPKGGRQKAEEPPPRPGQMT